MSELTISSAVLVQMKGLGFWFQPLTPSADVGFEGLDAAVVAALEQVGGDVGEEALDPRIQRQSPRTVET